jgi:hypothetical protein
MVPMVTSPEDKRNFVILKPLLDEVVEELVMCPQMKISKPFIQHETANETILAMPINETYPRQGIVCLPLTQISVAVVCKGQ